MHVGSQNPISQRIKEIRRERGLSQSQLAHPELSDSYISLIESGQRTPTPAVLELLASKLGCSVSYLINGVTATEMEDLELNLQYARLALENGETSEARRRYEELLDHEHAARLTSIRLEAAYGAALAAEACGDVDSAISMLYRLRERDGDSLTTERHIAIGIALSRCHIAQGDLKAAVQVAEQMMDEMAGPRWSGWTEELVELGATLLGAYLERGDLLRAHHFTAELLSAANALGTPRAIVAANWNAATAADLTGRGDEAVPLAERALAVQSETGDPRNLARLRVEYAFIRLRNRPSDAATCRDILLNAEEELRRSAASTIDRAHCHLYLAHAEMALGHAEQCLKHATSGMGLLGGSRSDLNSELHLITAHANLLLDRRAEASIEVHEAMKWLETQPASRFNTESWITAAVTLEQLGDQEASAIAYQRAMECGGL